MKKTLFLFASMALLLTACSKDSSDPVTPTPVTGDGTGRYTFSMDTASYRVDTLLVSYRGRDGQTKTATVLGQNNWSSPDLVFKTGDSIRADIQAFGQTKKSSPLPPAGLSFEVFPSTIAVPTAKSTGGSNSTPITGNRFQHSSSRYSTY